MERSRAFLYGESIYTTLRVENGRAFLAKAHLQRLQQGAAWLWPGHEGEVLPLWQNTQVPNGTGVWRLTLHLIQSGRSHEARSTAKMELDSWFEPGLALPENLSAHLVKAPPRLLDWPPFVKGGDTLPRLIAARGVPVSDVVLFHEAGRVCEFLHANIFLSDSSNVVTPPIGHQVLAGVGRERLLQLLHAKKIPVIERPIHLSELANYSACWAVNAVRGPLPVGRIDLHSFPGHPILLEVTQEFFHGENP